MLPWAKTILERLKEELNPRGFRKSGGTFVKDVDGCIQFVNLQASQFGDSQRQKYTLNLAVFCEGLSSARGGTERASWVGGHWSARIGDFTREHRDTWWEVRAEEDARAAAEEMVAVLLPALEVLDAMASSDSILNFRGDYGGGSFPGRIREPVVDAARAAAGLPPLDRRARRTEWRDAWSRARFPNATMPTYPLRTLRQVAPAQDAPVEGAN